VNNPLSVFEFFDECQSYFPCRWLTAPSASHRGLTRSDGTCPLISYINPLREPIVSVADYSENLTHSHFRKTQIGFITHVLDLSEAFFPEFSFPFPIIATTANSNDVIETLLPYLQKKLRRPASYHGVMLDVLGKGVFLMGPSGSGKSECAQRLLSRGHRLISDDITYFYRAKSNQIIGYAPPPLQNLLEIRGLGAIDVRHWYGPCSVLKEKSLDLVITLSEDPNQPSPRPFRKELGETIILGVSVPHITLDLAFKRDLAMLIESAVQFAFSTESPP
jgi:hypothetical protein